jgi:haloacetate dehalogenase
LHQPAEIWKAYANDIRDAQALPCGHYLSEEAPEETYRAMRAFFSAR